MKQCLFFAFVLVTTTAYDQSGRTASDTMAKYIKASVSNVIRLAENPQKTATSLMTDLRETNQYGEPAYSAPFPLPGYKAVFRKTGVSRAKGLGYWQWEAMLIETPKGSKPAEVKALKELADSMMKTFSQYIVQDKSNAITSVFALSMINFSASSTDYVELRVGFTKPEYQTEQQAYDSLLALYKPLLANPATSQGATSKFCYALLREGFTESRAVSSIKEILPEIADQSIEAAYGISMGLPYFVKYNDVKVVLTNPQQEKLKTMAEKFIKDYEEEWKRRMGKTDPVVVQQKQQQAKKLFICDTRDADGVDPILWTKGMTFTGFVNNTPYFGILTNIDCKTSHVTITKPGTTKGTEPPKHIRIHFLAYGTWKKHVQQYYTCSRCGGEGGESITKTETKTKELPFGYFEGIRTTVTKTKTETVWMQCYQCKGTGLTLEADRDPWNKK